MQKYHALMLVSHVWFSLQVNEPEVGIGRRNFNKQSEPRRCHVVLRLLSLQQIARCGMRGREGAGREGSVTQQLIWGWVTGGQKSAQAGDAASGQASGSNYPSNADTDIKAQEMVLIALLSWVNKFLAPCYSLTILRVRGVLLWDECCQKLDSHLSRSREERLTALTSISR